MKTIKGLSLFAGLVVLVSSCFNPPEFAVEPSIEFEDIYFADAPDGSGKTDSLVVSINFKDGDGDLGLDGSNPEHEEYPYNASNLFLSNNEKLIPVGLAQHWSDISYYFVDFPEDEERPEGKLVTLKTRDLPGYGSLPAFNDCDYLPDSIIMVDGPDADILDPTFHNIIDTMTSQSYPPIYVLKDTFYIAPNPNHYNISVTILMKDGDDWTPYGSDDPCSPQFNGRFPVLSDKDDSPLEGTLRYSLKSFGFKIELSTKTLKVQVQIKDRKLHTSNTVESPEFTLQKILR